MLRPMPYYRRHNYNTNNFHAYAPFIFENNNLIITPEFHSKIQNTWVETELNKVFDSVTVKEGVVYGKVPEVEDVPEDEYDRFFKVYKIFDIHYINHSFTSLDFFCSSNKVRHRSIFICIYLYCSSISPV